MTADAVLMITLGDALALSDVDSMHLTHPAVGGVILFSRHFADAEQLRALTADIRRAARRPILIAADQEGGRVQRFRGGGFTDIPAAATLYQQGGTAAAQDAGLVMAAELRAAGVDFSFAPVLDMGGEKSQVIGNRAFAAEADETFRAAHAFALGMRQVGMASCGKHFPGHGNVAADSHHELPIDNRPPDTIFSQDLTAFAQWAQHNMPALMTAHVVYSQCDENAATFSRYWLQIVLRGQLRYRGMIISDDLTMAGADIGGLQSRMAAALSAGCDGLLACGEAAPALAAMDAIRGKAKTAPHNPWLALAPQTDGIVCIGDAEYRRAKSCLEKLNATPGSATIFGG